MTAMRNKFTNKIFIIANTHLYWDSSKINDQLHELLELNGALTNYVDEIHDKFQLVSYQNFGEEPNFSNVPIILCGDFNNNPKSVVYKYVIENFCKNHKINFRSAYDIYKKLMNNEEINDQYGFDFEPNFTTFNYRRRWTIDYIFYNMNSLKVTHLLKLPTSSELDAPQQNNSSNLTNSSGIPNSEYPSDHLALLATFSTKE